MRVLGNVGGLEALPQDQGATGIKVPQFLNKYIYKVTQFSSGVP